MVESVLENPSVVLARQSDKARDELFVELKSEGVDYEERLARLDEVEWPKPLKEFLYTTFDAWAVHHPWLGQENLRPKSIVRDLYERAMTFREYVSYYGIKGSEGVLLRYLTDAFKGLQKTVPDSLWTSELEDLFEWLGALVRQVDSSLLDEWERLQNPEQLSEEIRPQAVDITTQTRAFQVMIRNATFRWVQLLSRRDYVGLAQEAEGDLSDVGRVKEVVSSYWEDFSEVATDAEARSSRWLVETARDQTQVIVEQIVCDPEGFNEWRLRGVVELEASREAGEAVVKLTDIVKL